MCQKSGSPLPEPPPLLLLCLRAASPSCHSRCETTSCAAHPRGQRCRELTSLRPAGQPSLRCHHGRWATLRASSSVRRLLVDPGSPFFLSVAGAETGQQFPVAAQISGGASFPEGLEMSSVLRSCGGGADISLGHLWQAYSLGRAQSKGKEHGT